ncbi:MAG: metallophosphoesterase [Verrucomicrobia bacterium]|nr:MAG: metallophosphoesterase [Verrucomicrobiota bacterium]
MFMPEKVLAIVLLWMAGMGGFFFILNRWILFTRDFGAKPLMMAVTFSALILGSVWYGWQAGFSPWVWGALVLLVVELLAEMRLHWLRWRMAGAPPVWQENVTEQLTQPFTTQTLAIRRYEIRLPQWHGPRLRIAHVTDFHLNGMLPDSHYRLVMERVRQAEPDLVFLTGDYVSEENSYAAQLPQFLGKVHGRLGSFAILGNHDYWADATPVRDGLRTAGFQTLENGFQTLEIGGQSVMICGCEDPWGDTKWHPPPHAENTLLLALSHTADNIYRLAKAGAQMVFSGHYHAGQWRLPWVGPLMVPSRFGRRFAHGHFEVRGAHLFVSAGIGITRIPFRIYCRPDIFIVDILPEN